jgi:hypothetical protein
MNTRKRTGGRPTKLAGKMSGTSRTLLDRDIQAKIGDQLRALHDDIVKQGIPDRFAELLSRLDEASKEVKAKQSPDGN